MSSTTQKQNINKKKLATIYVLVNLQHDKRFAYSATEEPNKNFRYYKLLLQQLKLKRGAVIMFQCVLDDLNNMTDRITDRSIKSYFFPLKVVSNSLDKKNFANNQIPNKLLFPEKVLPMLSLMT